MSKFSANILYSTTQMVIVICILKQIYCQPFCEKNEVCDVFSFKPCVCPNNVTCGSKSGSVIELSTEPYKFCEPVEFGQCNEGDVAETNKGTRLTIHCACPSPMEIKEDSVGSSDIHTFKCFWPRLCNADEPCKVRNKNGEKWASVQWICDCGEGFRCDSKGAEKSSQNVAQEQEMSICRPSDSDEDE